MAIVGVQIWRVVLSLSAPVGTATGTHRWRPVIYVRVVSEDGEGWGESAALPGGSAVDPGHQEVWGDLVDDVAPRASSGLLGELEAPARLLGSLPGSGERATTAVRRAAMAALDMAAVDLRLGRQGRSLAAALGASTPQRVPVGTVVGIPQDRSVDALVAQVDRAVAAGYARVRVKVAPGWDLVPLGALREAFPRLALQADANASYRFGAPGADDAAGLVAWDRLSLACVEQPLAPGDLAGHARLSAMLGTPVALDESVCSLDDLEAALAAHAASVVCVKPARFGGLELAAEAVARCADAGVGVFVGGFFETGLGRAANLAVAALEGITLPGDLSDPATYLEDPCGYPEVRGGSVAVPRAPGVGRPPSPQLLAQRGAQSEWFPGSPGHPSPEVLAGA